MPLALFLLCFTDSITAGDAYSNSLSPAIEPTLAANTSSDDSLSLVDRFEPFLNQELIRFDMVLAIPQEVVCTRRKATRPIVSRLTPRCMCTRTIVCCLRHLTNDVLESRATETMQAFLCILGRIRPTTGYDCKTQGTSRSWTARRGSI